MILWEGVDPVEAEARMRGLNRRLAELDEALGAGQRIAANAPQSFSATLGLESLGYLQRRLEAERTELVKHRTCELVEVSLKGNEFSDHTAAVGELGVFLIRLQKLYSSVAQAITSGPTRRGPLSYDLSLATRMRFAEMFPSSFGMSLLVRPQFDIFGESTATAALQTLFTLLNAAEREAEFARLSAELGQRAVGHLRHVFDDLARSGSGFSLSWTDFAGTVYDWSASSDDIQTLKRNIVRFKTTRAEEVSINGFLIGASLLRDRFELFTSAGVIEGKMTLEAKAKIREFFGRQCLATFERVELLEAVTQETRTFHTMVDIAVAQPAIAEQ